MLQICLTQSLRAAGMQRLTPSLHLTATGGTGLQRTETWVDQLALAFSSVSKQGRQWGLLQLPGSQADPSCPRDLMTSRVLTVTDMQTLCPCRLKAARLKGPCHLLTLTVTDRFSKLLGTDIPVVQLQPCQDLGPQLASSPADAH